MDFAYGPIEEYGDPNGLKPLEWDDEVYEDEYVFEAEDGTFEYEDYEEPGLAGFDDLRPFDTFSDGMGWD